MGTTEQSSDFGVLLRAIRQNLGVIQRELAAGVGLSVSAVRDLEQGRSRRPRPAAVGRLVDALGLTGDDAAALRHAAAGAPRTSPLPAPRQSLDAEPPQLAILGPLTIRRGDQPVSVGRGARRVVLGRLALTPNAPVPPSELIGLIWDTPPPAPANALHTHLSRLRTALQPGSDQTAVISRTPTGYQLTLPPGRLDLADFRRQVGQARTAQPPQALDLLQAALALWRGSPVADIPALQGHPLVTAVAEEHIAATLRYADLAVAAGQPGRCLPQLRDLAAAHPLHEPLHARLIAALAASNLQAAALACYTEIRRRLVDDLGIEPGPELADLHRRVLRQQSSYQAPPPAPAPDSQPAPAQLPADIRRFTGRVAALARLDAVLDDGEHAKTVVIATVSGTPGVGKTALALHWAHRVRHRFPDGQLYVNLRGYDDGQVMDPSLALRGFLNALGVAAEQIPESLHAQAALYRSALAGRRMLVVLDNARDAEQVRPLLPGDAGIATVITSRGQLPGLVAVDGASPLTLDVLTGHEARELLAAQLGATSAGADPGAATQIIAACARLPLALTIAAACVQVTGFPLAAVAAQLADARRRLDVLDTGDRMGQIRTVFSWSYAALSPAAAQLFLLLGLHAGPDISAPAAASLAARPVSETLPLLTELTRASMLTEPFPGRYTFHDLLRAYAHEQARRHLTDGERAAAVRRVLTHGLQAAYGADRLINPYRDPITLPAPPPGVVTETHADRTAALAWLMTEHATLLAAVRSAADHGEHAVCWQLTWAVTGYFDQRGHWQDATVVGQIAVDAAHQDRLGQAHARSGLGRAYGWLGRHDDARTELGGALALFAELGDDIGQATVHAQLAWLLDRWDRHQEAYDSMAQALRRYQDAGHRPGIADALARLGFHEAHLGRPEAALDKTRRGLAAHRELGNRRGEAITMAMLANIHQFLHQLDDALSCYQRAAELLRQAGERYYEGKCLAALGDAYHDLGHLAEARAAWQQAVDILTELRHPEADAARAKLHRVAV